MIDILDELFPADRPLPPRDVLHRQYEFEGEYGERGELTVRQPATRLGVGSYASASAETKRKENRA